MKNGGKTIHYRVGNIIVCLLLEEGKVVSRGVSVCSRMDVCDEEKGRKKSMRRAKEAFGRKCDVYPIKLFESRGYKFDWFDLAIVKEWFGGNLGCYGPELTQTEKVLILRKGRYTLPANIAEDELSDMSDLFEGNLELDDEAMATFRPSSR